MRIRLSPIAACLGAALFAGCERPRDPEFVNSDRVLALKPELQTALNKELTEHSGTYAHPKLIGDEGRAQLAKGRAVYADQCLACHGESGEGDGPAADYLYPRPRDYRKGLFKFTSTPYGAKPLRSDLERTIRAGVRGTSMPSFHLLPEDEINAVIDYVMMLTHRGEFEEGLANQAEAEDVIDSAAVKEEVLPLVTQRWTQAETEQVQPLTPQPRFMAENVEAGKKAFLTVGCAKCHGEDGRGQMPDNIGKDGWGRTTRAADLTAGMFHGGQRPIDIYRRIYSGINGTPMPGFASALQSQPETIWNLVAYVKYVSSRRREGESPPPGPVKPYVPEAEKAADMAAK